MQPAADRELKVDAREEIRREKVGDGGEPPASASPSPAPEPGGPQAPALKTANFVRPEWRGIKYITPEVFRRRAYAYFGHHPAKSTMHRWLHSGRIAAVRVGNRWFIPESTWQEFLICCQNGERF
jgi:excisionase family DNA binding protein